MIGCLVLALAFAFVKRKPFASKLTSSGDTNSSNQSRS